MEGLKISLDFRVEACRPTKQSGSRGDGLLSVALSAERPTKPPRGRRDR